VAKYKKWLVNFKVLNKLKNKQLSKIKLRAVTLPQTGCLTIIGSN